MDKPENDKSLPNNQGIRNENIDDIDRPNINGNISGVDGGSRTDSLSPGGDAKIPMPNCGRRSSFSLPGFNLPRFVDIDGVSTAVPDVNVYQQKKTLAQGMMDLALLSANANQLRYVLETNRQHPYFYPGLFLIALSIIFQIVVGIGLIWNGKYNIMKGEQILRANRINNWTVIGIFIVTVVNVLISAFGVTAATPPL